MKQLPIVALLAALLLVAGCATAPVTLDSNPPGASALVNNALAGTTPTQAVLDKEKDNFVRFELPGYFPEELTVPRGSDQKEVSVEMAPSRLTRNFQIATDPPGATILIDGVQVGTTPAKVDVTFGRESKEAPWRDRRLVLSLPDYQTESFRLPESLPGIGLVHLALLRDERVYHISTVTPDGQSLKADVLLDGKPAGETPLDLPITFRRPNKGQPWPEFTVTVRVPGQYREEQAAINFSSYGPLRFVLSPLSEIATTQILPGPVMTPTGISWTMRERKAVAVLNTREPSEAVAELTQVTNFARQDLRGSAYVRTECINSFTVSPDGQNVIFGLTLRDPEGNLYSNLFLKRADGGAGGISQLTEGSRYIDTQPKIANDGSNFLVFTSNRGDRTKPDIFRSSLIDNSLAGGISRLTNDLRFNFSPTYGEANRQVFYLSVEPNYPLAETQLSSIRINGSLPTQLSATALEIDNSVPDRVYFVRMDEDAKKKQIYSIQADGKLETALINQENLKAANCFNPAPSPDGGSRIAFVSDAGVDEHLRHNNDLYVMNADGTGLERLTQNGSDDIAPAWSPSEDGVLYFLSNRGGAYNIWRMKLRGGANPTAGRRR
jgi:hypothetical protein